MALKHWGELLPMRNKELTKTEREQVIKLRPVDVIGAKLYPPCVSQPQKPKYTDDTIPCARTLHTIPLLRCKRSLECLLENSRGGDVTKKTAGTLPPVPSMPEPPSSLLHKPNVSGNLRSNFAKGIGEAPPPVSSSVAWKILRKSVGTICAHIGFDVTTTTVLDTLTDIVDEYIKRICELFYVHAFKKPYPERCLFPDALERTFQDLGLEGIICLHNFYQTRVVKYHNYLMQDCPKLLSRYQKLRGLKSVTVKKEVMEENQQKQELNKHSAMVEDTRLQSETFQSSQRIEDFVLSPDLEFETAASLMDKHSAKRRKKQKTGNSRVQDELELRENCAMSEEEEGPLSGTSHMPHPSDELYNGQQNFMSETSILQMDKDNVRRKKQRKKKSFRSQEDMESDQNFQVKRKEEMKAGSVPISQNVRELQKESMTNSNFLLEIVPESSLPIKEANDSKKKRGRKRKVVRNEEEVELEQNSTVIENNTELFCEVSRIPQKSRRLQNVQQNVEPELSASLMDKEVPRKERQRKRKYTRISASIFDSDESDVTGSPLSATFTDIGGPRQVSKPSLLETASNDRRLLKPAWRKEKK